MPGPGPGGSMPQPPPPLGLAMTRSANRFSKLKAIFFCARRPASRCIGMLRQRANHIGDVAFFHLLTQQWLRRPCWAA